MNRPSDETAKTASRLAALQTIAASNPAAAPRNVIAVASGKGGVGKTWLAISIAYALSRSRSCVLFDGDLGLANVDVQLGLNPGSDLTAALASREPLESVMQSVEGSNLKVIAGRSGSGSLASMTPAQLQILGKAIARLAYSHEAVILDLGAGIDRTVRALAANAGLGIVVTNEEPTSLTDAYAYIKVVKQQRPQSDLRVVVNQAKSHKDGERTYATLRRACENFLKLTPPLLGVVRRDDRVRESIRVQAPLLQRFPNAEAAEDVEKLAARLMEAI